MKHEDPEEGYTPEELINKLSKDSLLWFVWVINLFLAIAIIHHFIR